MPGLIHALLALLVVWLLGALLLTALRLRQRRWPLAYAQPAVDFAVGSGILAMVWSCAALARLPMRPALVYLMVLLLALAAGIRALKRKDGAVVSDRQWPSAPRVDKWLLPAVLALTCILLAHVAIKAYSEPVYWDGRYIWGFKSKAMFVDGGIGREAFSNVARYRPTALDHPPSWPGLQAWVYQSMGYVDERRAKVVGAVWWLAVLLMLSSYLRRRMAWSWALLVGLLACAVPVFAYHAGAGAADVQQGFYLLVAALLLADWLEHGRREDAVLAALVLGAGMLVKPEGASMALGGAIAFLVAAKVRGWQGFRGSAPLAAAAVVLPVLPWMALRVAWHIPSLQLSQMHVRPVPELVSRAMSVVNALAHQAVAWHLWELAWFVVAAGLVGFVVTKSRERQIGLLWGLFVWQLAVYAVYYTLSPYDINWILGASLERLLLHLMPLGIVAAAASLLPAPRAKAAGRRAAA